MKLRVVAEKASDQPAYYMGERITHYVRDEETGEHVHKGYGSSPEQAAARAAMTLVDVDPFIVALRERLSRERTERVNLIVAEILRRPVIEET